jgi:hypothetical protein
MSDIETLEGEEPIVGGEYFFRARLDPVQAYQIDNTGDVQTEVRALFGTGDETRDFDDTVTSVRLHTAAGILIAFPGNWIVQLGSRVHVMDDKDFKAFFVSHDEMETEEAAAEAAAKAEVDCLEAEKLEQERQAAEAEKAEQDRLAAEQTDRERAEAEGDTGADKPA